jgi:hypothetical protein
MEHDAMARVTQEVRTALPVVQNTVFPFHAQLKLQASFGGHPAHQTFRAMDVQIVDHEMPLAGLLVAGHDRLHVGRKVGFGAGRPGRRGDALPTHHITTEDERTCTAPDVLKLAAFDLTGGQRQARVHALQGLDLGHLVRPQRADSLLRPDKGR